MGQLRLVADDDALLGVYFPNHPRAPGPQPEARAEHPVLDEAATQIESWLSGKLTTFTVPIRLVGTDFQQQVWAALLQVPYGETTTYSALTTTLGMAETSIRAVAGANARNPISIIVPCHRVIGADGSLTGYAGGLRAKRWLLDHEAEVSGAARTLRLL